MNDVEKLYRTLLGDKRFYSIVGMTPPRVEIGFAKCEFENWADANQASLCSDSYSAGLRVSLARAPGVS